MTTTAVMQSNAARAAFGATAWRCYRHDGLVRHIAAAGSFPDVEHLPPYYRKLARISLAATDVWQQRVTRSRLYGVEPPAAALRCGAALLAGSRQYFCRNYSACPGCRARFIIKQLDKLKQLTQQPLAVVDVMTAMDRGGAAAATSYVRELRRRNWFDTGIRFTLPRVWEFESAYCTTVIARADSLELPRVSSADITHVTVQSIDTGFSNAAAALLLRAAYPCELLRRRGGHALAYLLDNRQIRSCDYNILEKGQYYDWISDSGRYTFTPADLAKQTTGEWRCLRELETDYRLLYREWPQPAFSW